MSDKLDQNFIMAFDKQISFQTKDEEIEHWKKLAIGYRHQYQDVEKEYTEFHMYSSQLEQELELTLNQATEQVKFLEPRNTQLEEDLSTLKANLAKVKSENSQEIDNLQSQVEYIKTENDIHKLQVTELQIHNDKLEQQNKIVKASYSDVQNRHDETLEQNIYLAQEMQEKDSHGKREIQRLLDELRDLRTEMSVRDKRTLVNAVVNTTATVATSPPIRLQNSAKPITKPITSSPMPNLTMETNYKQFDIIDNNNNNNNSNKSNMPALSILGDILRKVGSVESRLANCKSNFSKESLRRGPRPTSPSLVPSTKRMHVQLEDDYVLTTTVS